MSQEQFNSLLAILLKCEDNENNENDAYSAGIMRAISILAPLDFGEFERLRNQYRKKLDEQELLYQYRRKD